MIHSLVNSLLNCFTPLKIKAPKGAIVGCSLFRLRWRYRGEIKVTPGNTIVFQGTMNKAKDSNRCYISLSGKNNSISITLPTFQLPSHLEVGGENNKVSIGKNFKSTDGSLSWFWFGHENSLIIKDNVVFNMNPRVPSAFNRISMGGGRCRIEIKEYSMLSLNIISSPHNACQDFSFKCGPHACIGGLIVTPSSPCEVFIGKDVQVSWNVYIGCGSHALIDEDGNCRNVCQGVRIGDNCWIGTNVVIPGTSIIPQGCIVGSNAVVTKSFEDENCAIGGVPAKVIKHGVKWVWEHPGEVLRRMRGIL